ncbi:hypothetical protein [Streptomyces sp. NPDC002855]|uniref:hypothetical protein n=1 Tax=Streptomyces sp. NPDC002855 TaxID=3154437 RepID=UPI0033196A96
MFSFAFVKRMAEQMAVAFVVGFGGVMLAGDGEVQTSLAGAALAAGLRGVYGVLVKGLGDPEQPSVK